MTKSFTASAILLLRDEGALRLDDLAEEYVPELRGWPSVSPDSVRVSLRHLLTMTAGFPTDDPWGDRQQGLPLEEFGKFLAAGVSFNWAPGTGFEYSNLGYAILGRVITAVTGAAYPDYVRDRLLRPLAMARTGYEADEFDPQDLALGYQRSPGGWSQVPSEPCGAFAPMGGIFSCVRDLARWVAGFTAAFPPGQTGQAGQADDDPHPSRRATRREMQLPQVLTGWDKPVALPGDQSAPLSGYGFGLFVEEHPVLGRMVSHSGGYPGFGSNMRWHPASRTGVITLGNSSYAAMKVLATRLLEAAIRLVPPPAYGYGVALAPGANGPWPETLAARDAVGGLLRAWDDAEAARLFSPNVAQDIPFAERRRGIDLIRERIGEFGDDPGRPPEFDTPAHCRWWLAGEHGTVQAQIQLTPERPPRVQSLALAVPPAAGSPLQAMLDTLVAWLNGPDAGWPPSVPVTGTLDAALLARRLRTAAAWAGRCRVGACKAGDGTGSVEVELVGEHATLTLALAIDPQSHLLRQADAALY
jgi:CubicO group peptidase (beta-lactamase class C family)